MTPLFLQEDYFGGQFLFPEMFVCLFLFEVIKIGLDLMENYIILGLLLLFFRQAVDCFAVYKMLTYASIK